MVELFWANKVKLLDIIVPQGDPLIYRKINGVDISFSIIKSPPQKKQLCFSLIFTQFFAKQLSIPVGAYKAKN